MSFASTAVELFTNPMIAETRRPPLRAELPPMTATGAIAVLMFAGYCQIHSWFDAAAVPTDVSLRWGLAMGIPCAVAARLFWRKIAEFGSFAGRGVQAAASLWMAFVAMGVTIGASVHLIVSGIDNADFPVRWIERMYDLLPVVAALSALLVCLSLLHRFRVQPRTPDIVTHEDWISFPQSPSLLLRPSSIRCVKSAGNYCEIHADDRVHTVRMTLSQAEKQLEPYGFARSHRTLIVNANRIVDVSAVRHARAPIIRLDSGEACPLGKAYAPDFIARLRQN
ncbi:MAG: LytTR family transcriptional regulator [Sphingopyxis sp.]|nr:LytTR family transcriptional regulator [Sphingopyxis sp.]